jgi:hypothetical protein
VRTSGFYSLVFLGWNKPEGPVYVAWQVTREPTLKAQDSCRQTLVPFAGRVEEPAVEM